MTPLRQRMIGDMRIRNLAATTQRSYVHYVAEFAKYFQRSPEHLDLEAVRQYQLYLVEERKLSPQSINSFVSAVQFLFLTTLEMPWSKEDFPRARLDHKLPVVLAPEEVQTFFENVTGVKNRAILFTCYGAGLRISEAVALKVSDVDSKRKLLRVEHGKGGKDRYAMLSPCLLEVLRAYWRIVRPTGLWLFPAWRPHKHAAAGAVQSACRDAWKSSRLGKRVTPHLLRHSFATHLVEGGADLPTVQALLGHTDLKPTSIYLHLSERHIKAAGTPLDNMELSSPDQVKRSRKLHKK